VWTFCPIQGKVPQSRCLNTAALKSWGFMPIDYKRTGKASCVPDVKKQNKNSGDPIKGGCSIAISWIGIETYTDSSDF